jgi:molecular chaperone DnaK
MIDYSNIPRDSRRVPLETRVQFSFDRFSGFISEFSSNISPGGIFIKTRKPLPAGQMLDFEFRLGDGFELINGSGQVVWTRAEDEGPNRPDGMGIRFLDLSEESKELIYKIVDTYIQEGGIPFDVSLVPPDPVSPSASANPVPWPPPLPAQDPAGPDLDATSGLPPLDDLPPSPAAFAGGGDTNVPNYLPALPPPQEPRRGPFNIAGSASAKTSERPLPWVLIGVLALLGVALFVFRDQWLGLVGLGGEDVVAEAPPRPLPRPRVNPAAALSTDLTTDLAANGDNSEMEAEPEPETLPEPVRRKPAIELDPSAAPPPASAPAATAPAPAPPAATPPTPRPAAPAGPPASALERISWNPLAGGGTEIVLWGNGSLRPGAYTRVRLDASPPREVVRIQGMLRPYPQTRVPVGSGEVAQVRTGYHPGNELHVVIDLASSAVQVVRVVEDGNKLRIELRKR